jgi:hypothetical protein
MKKDKQGSKGGAVGQPIDPTRSGEDFIGDTTGLTGVTTGNAEKTSATPTDTFKDENKNHLPGGIIPSKINDVHGRRLSPDLYIDEEYDKDTFRGMSSTRAAIGEDIATEDDVENSGVALESAIDSDKEPYLVNKKDASGNDAPGTDGNNSSGATYSQPEHLGEQAVSGSTPDPTADDDTLEAAHAVGTQLNEDEEHPQELDIARDIDKAEESIRTH